MWRLVDLGPVDGYTMTNLYEAVGHAVSEGSVKNTIILNHPSKPFVNIGFHQLMEKEINVDFAKKMEFDLVRRTIGGGAILDGPWEQDYFVVVNRRSEVCPSSISEFYRKFLKPPLLALKKMGLDASLRPPNDILVRGKKISGNGAITIENSNVLAGDLLLDVPTDLMSHIIKVPSEKFQDKLAKTMAEWMTSIRKELGEDVERTYVKDILVTSFEESIGIELKQEKLTSNEIDCLHGLIEERAKEEWIYGKDLVHQELVNRGKGITTKVRGGIIVSEATHKAGKLIRATVVFEDNEIRGISISGDFFTQPYQGAISGLEKALIGVPLEEETLRSTIKAAFDDLKIVVFGASPEDFIKTILKTKVNGS